MRVLVARLLVALLVSAIGQMPSRVSAQTTGAVTAGQLNLTSTFNSIGVELFFTGDDNANATATLEFRKSGDQSWRTALAMWRTEPSTSSPGRAFYGSALLLDPGTVYELRITLNDPDGVAGQSVISGEVKTRVEDIADRASLSPTYFVAPDGDDANDGTASGHAWRTLDHVIKVAPAGAIVDVAPGHYAAPAAKTVRSTPLVLTAHNPAVSQQLQVIGGEQRTVVVEANAGGRSVVEPAGSDGGPSVSAPTDASDADLVDRPINRIAPWQQVTFQGVDDPTQSYTVWKWTASPVTTATEMGFASTRDATPTRVANWFPADGFDTPQKWAEQVYTHPDWRSGFWSSDKDGRHFTDENGQDTVTNRTDVYVRLPGDASPNDNYVTVSAAAGAGITIDGADVRVSGLEFRTNERDVEIRAHAARAVIDNCLLQVGYIGVSVDGQPIGKSTPGMYGTDHVIQGNLIRDNSLTTTDPTNAPAIPWDFIKDDSGKPGRYSETGGVGGNGGGRHMVVRNNTFDGLHDGVTGYHAGFDRYSNQDLDVYANYFRNLQDDAIEPSRGSINVRIWDNRMDQVLDVFSIAAPTWGPVYFFRNEAWRFGNEIVPAAGDGRIPGGQAVKYGAIEYRDNPPPARVFILLNTFWSDVAGADGVVRSGDPGKNQPFMYLRDNVIRVGEKAARIDAPDRWDEDADDFSSGDASQPAAMQTPSGRFRSDVNAYRANTGQGGHTNLRANFGTVADAELADPNNGDLHLAPASALIDKGVLLANLADQVGINFVGAAPDLGAVEQN